MCFCVDSLCSVRPVPNVAQNLPVGARLSLFLGNLECPWGKSKGSTNVESKNQKSLGFYNRLFLVPKPNNKWGPILDLSNLNKFLKEEKFKMETPETIRTSNRGVGNIHRLQGCLLPYTHSEPVKKISQVPCTGQNIPVQGPTFRFINSSSGVHCCNQRGQTNGFTERYKDPPVPQRLTGPGEVPPSLSPAYSNTGSSLSGFRLISQHRKVRTGPQTSFRLRRLPV